jgi:hypothetical protein
VGDARRIRCGWMAVAQDQDGWMNASDQRWEASGRGDEGRKVEWMDGWMSKREARREGLLVG